MKIQRFGFDYNDDKRTIVFVCNDGEMINYKDHEAKMQQAMRIIKKLRGERQEYIKLIGKLADIRNELLRQLDE